MFIVTRNITHNAESWVVHRRANYGKNVSFVESMENMVKSTEALMKAVESSKAPKCWTTYEDIRKCPEKEAIKFAKFMGINMTEDMKNKINDFIMPEYTTLKK